MKLKSNRAAPSIAVVTDDPRSHTLAIQAIKESVEIGQRRTKDVLNSYIRVQDLIDLGILVISPATGDIELAPTILTGGGP